MTRLAEKAPAYCSSCGNADSSVRHVDFESAWDGPVIGNEIKVSIDDLVICEGCLLEAFAILDPQGLLIENKRLEDENQSLYRELEAKDKIVNNYHATTTELVDHPIRKPKARPAIVGVPKEAKKELTAQRVKRENRKKRVAA